MARTRILAAASLAAGLALTAACGGGPSRASFCTQLKRSDTVRGDAYKGAADDPTRFKRFFGKAQEEWHKLDSKAPKDIKGDAHVIRETMDKVVAALQSVDPKDEAALLRALEPLQADLGRFEAANKNVVQYSKDKCGLDLTTSTTSRRPG